MIVSARYEYWQRCAVSNIDMLELDVDGQVLGMPLFRRPGSEVHATVQKTGWLVGASLLTAQV